MTLPNFQATLQYSLLTSKEQLDLIIPKFREAGTSFAMIDGILYMSKSSYEILSRGETNE